MNASLSSRVATLGALLALIAVSIVTGIAAQTLLRGWTLVGLASIALAAWRPTWAIAALLAVLPIFGNKPGLRQVYALVLLGSGMNIGLALRGLVSWPRPERPAGSWNPLFVLLMFYGIASILTLSTLPLSQIWYDSLSSLDGSLDPISHMMLWLKARETDALYSLLSVIFTWYAIALACFIRREITIDPRAVFFFARAIVVGLMMALIVGILNFYGLVDLRPLRALDPVVNFFGQQRLQATFGHSGWFAEYVVMSMAWLGTVLIAFRRVRLGIALIIALLLVAQFGLILTYQRGGWIAHVFPLLTIWFSIFYVYSGQQSEQPAFRDLVRRSLPKVALAVPLTIGIALVVFLAIASLGWFGTQFRFGASSYAERFATLLDTSNRSMYLSTGLKLGRLHPVLGAGSESFAYTYWSEYLRPGGAFYGQGDPLPVLYGSAHNIYLQTLTGKGLVGLALLLSLMGYVVIGGIRILLRQPDLPKPIVLILLATIGSTLGVACYGVVQEVFYIQSIQYVIFAAVGIAGSLAEPWLHLRTRTVRWLALALALLFIVHLGFEYGYPGRMRDRWFWQKAVREGNVLGITELDSRGTRFRWSGARAYLDLPCSAKSITVPVRSLSNVPQNVEILVNDRMIDRVALVDHNWRELKYPLPKSPWYLRSHCVELRVDPLWQAPGDTRQLGVMVGMYSSAQ